MIFQLSGNHVTGTFLFFFCDCLLKGGFFCAVFDQKFLERSEALRESQIIVRENAEICLCEKFYRVCRQVPEVSVCHHHAALNLLQLQLEFRGTLSDSFERQCTLESSLAKLHKFPKITEYLYYRLCFYRRHVITSRTQSQCTPSS